MQALCERDLVTARYLQKKKLGEVTFVQACVSHEDIKKDYYYMYSIVYITI